MKIKSEIFHPLFTNAFPKINSAFHMQSAVFKLVWQNMRHDLEKHKSAKTLLN